MASEYSELIERLTESAKEWINEVDTRKEAALAIQHLLYRVAELEKSRSERDQLIYAVASKFPDETRFETALRYIRQAESVSGGTGPGHAAIDAAIGEKQK